MEAQPFEIRANGCHFVKNYVKYGHKRIDFEWSDIFSFFTIQKLDHLQSAIFLTIQNPAQCKTLEEPGLRAKNEIFSKYISYLMWH